MRVFNEFRFNNLRGDIFGGLTAAIISLPLALAFGVASGAGPAAGLYGAIIVGLFAAIFGGTPTLISEPTGPMTVVMTAVITAMIAQNPDNGMAMAFTVVMIAGVFQILLGLLKLGKYITLMPYSVISGFMSGIGVILILLQIGPFLGHPTPGGGALGTVQALPSLLQNLKWSELFLGLVTLGVLFFIPKRISRMVPPQLIALVLVTLLSLLLFSQADVRRIGEIPLGNFSLTIPTFTSAQLTSMLIDGVILGTLGCIDSLLTAVISDSLTRKEHNSDKELIGQGVGNLVSGFCGGLPGAGATMGTVVSIQAGARSAVSGVVRALVLLVVVLGAAKLTESIPMAVLAGIALKVGLNILDWSFVKRAHQVSFQAACIMYGVMLLTVFVDLMVAVGIGIFIANMLTISRLSELQSKNIRAISNVDEDVPLSRYERELMDKIHGRAALVYFSGPMMFGVSKAIAREQSTIHQYESAIFDLSNVPSMDVTISLAIENAVKDTLDAGLPVFIVKPTHQAHDSLARLGVFGLVPDSRLCRTRSEALEKVLEWLASKRMGGMHQVVDNA